MYKYKLPKDLKKRMDRELRQYWLNKQKLEHLELEIIESSSPKDNQYNTNSISDSTSQKAIKLISTRSILYCKERISYIENVINRLNSFEKQMFENIFKNGYDWLYCETIYHVSKSTYYNVYNKCIYFLAEEWGEI